MDETTQAAFGASIGLDSWSRVKGRPAAWPAFHHHVRLECGEELDMVDPPAVGTLLYCAGGRNPQPHTSPVLSVEPAGDLAYVPLACGHTVLTNRAGAARYGDAFCPDCYAAGRSSNP